MDTISSGKDGLTIPEQELLHLAACDVCFVLDVSKGAGEEIAHFISSGFGHKLVILTHEKYKNASSFPAALRKYGNQLFFNDEEYDRCHLVDRVGILRKGSGYWEIGSAVCINVWPICGQNSQHMTVRLTNGIEPQDS